MADISTLGSGGAVLRSRDVLVLVLESRGLSERELAKRAGLSHATVNHLFTGRRTTCLISTAALIEKALDVPAGSLFSGAGR